MEHSVSEIIKYFTTMLLILFLFGVAIMCKDMADINSFKNYVNIQIERNGGYTDKAKANIELKSKNDYSGLFELRKPDSTEKLQTAEVNYGDVVTYDIYADIPLPFTLDSDISIPINARGEAVSRTRGN